MRALVLILAKLIGFALPEGLDLASYDTFIVAMSGGKDSIGCLLWLLLLGVPRGKIELWHHDVDGREGSTLFDWPVTRAYCVAVAKAFGLPIYFSWKKHGLEGEMRREMAATAGYSFETPQGLRHAGGKSKRRSTRRRHPQKSANLRVRWCSAYGKIMVMDAAIRGQLRFRGKRTLVVTGERAEESSARAKYKVFEKHRSDRRGSKHQRHVDHYRPMHTFTNTEVWALFELARLAPHPAYLLGWGRVSCAACIFGSKHQWATLRELNPPQFQAHVVLEVEFKSTIDRKRSLPVLAARGTPYVMREADKLAALATTYEGPIFLDTWELPAGAAGETCGPT